MSLHPEVASMLEALNSGFPDVTTVPPPELRDIIRSRRAPLQHLPAMREVHDLTIDGPGGVLALRIYRPESTEPELPVVVFAHGGGFVFCDLDSHDEFCRAMAEGVSVVVVSVDYRLAPEHRAPAAHEDMYAALEWAAENAANYGAIRRGSCSPATVPAEISPRRSRSRLATTTDRRVRSGPVLPGDRRRFRHRVVPEVRVGVLQHDQGDEVVLGAVRSGRHRRCTSSPHTDRIPCRTTGGRSDHCRAGSAVLFRR